MRSPMFGPIIQHAFVVRDMDAALAYWIDVMGVGPFFRVDNATYKSALYRNEPASPSYAVALAYWGDSQIELVMPTDEAPSYEEAERTLNEWQRNPDAWEGRKKHLETAERFDGMPLSIKGSGWYELLKGFDGSKAED